MELADTFKPEELFVKGTVQRVLNFVSKTHNVRNLLRSGI